MTTPVFGLPVSNFVSLYKIAFLNICLICIVVKKAGSIGEDFKISITSISGHAFISFPFQSTAFAR